MRIAYGVHGYGRGHAMRALAVLPALTARHELAILAGGDAYDALAGEYTVTQIPVLKFALSPTGRRSKRRTIKRNLPGVMDLKMSGPALDMVVDTLTKFRPDVVVSDSEPWTHHAARRLEIPRISFDHFGVLVHCRWPMPMLDRLVCRLEAGAYRKLMGRPQRVVVASFYDAPPRRPGVRVVGPVLREQVRKTEPSPGEYLLVYFSNGRKHYTERVHRALLEQDIPVWVYGTGREGREGNVQFLPLSNTRFVSDLAACRAVFSTAGNQLISEAMHFGKPLLLMPEDSLEQRLNAAMVEHLGYGRHLSRRDVAADVIGEFLADGDRLAANIGAADIRDGGAEAVAAIEQYARELAGGDQG